MRRAVRITRHAISPRLAIRILLNISTNFPNQVRTIGRTDEIFRLRRGFDRVHFDDGEVKYEVDMRDNPVRNDLKSFDAQNTNAFLRVPPYCAYRL